MSLLGSTRRGSWYTPPMPQDDMTRIYDDEKIEEIRALYKHGLSCYQLSEIYYVHPNTIRNYCLDIIRSNRGTREGKLTFQQRAEMVRRYESGESAAALGTEYGVASTAVYYFLGVRA